MHHYQHGIPIHLDLLNLFCHVNHSNIVLTFYHHHTFQNFNVGNYCLNETYLEED